MTICKDGPKTSFKTMIAISDSRAWLILELNKQIKKNNHDPNTKFKNSPVNSVENDEPDLCNVCWKISYFST